MSETEFDLEFEEDILAWCLRRKSFVKQASSVLDAHHFGTEKHSWVWQIIKNTWDSHHEKATIKLFINESRSEFTDDDEQAAALELVAKLIALRPENPKASLAALTTFVRFVKLQSASEQMVRFMEKGKIDEAYGAISAVARKDAEPRGFESSDFVKDFANRLAVQRDKKNNPDKYPVIPTGIQQLDKIIGGIRQKEVAMILATTGVGKSVLSVNLGYSALKKRRELGICHFSTEMYHAVVQMRYDTRFTGLLHKKFKESDFTRRELKAMLARLKKVHKLWAGRLHVVSAPVRSVTLAQCRAKVSQMNDENEVPIGLVIFDSPDHVIPERQHRDASRLEASDTYWSAKSWAEEDAISMWVTTQAGRGAVDKVATAEMASDSYDKSRIADVIVSLNKPNRKSRATPKVEIGEDDDDGNNEDTVVMKNAAGLELQLTKHRDGEGNITIDLSEHSDLSRMLIRSGDADAWKDKGQK